VTWFKDDDRIPARFRVTLAVRRSKLSAPAKLVMLILADVADVGTAEVPSHRTPSLTVLAREAGLSRSTVAKHLSDLERAGWVVRARPSTAEALGSWERTRYQLQVPASEASAHAELVREPAEASPVDGPPSAAPGLPSAGDGLALVREPDPPSAADGHRDRSLTDKNQIDPSSSSQAPKAELAVPERLDVERICKHLADRIEANGSARPTITKAWRDAGRLLLDRDGKTVDQVLRAIDWCQNDEFWRANILSMPKLRKQYHQLRLHAKRGTNGSRPSTTDERVGQGLALAAELDANPDLLQEVR
jgi:DNA-binding transcriptional ArsR family regulator